MNKKIFLSVAAVGLLAASLTACGDSSSGAKSSKAEDCAAGLSAECLEGSWNLVGLALISTDPANPGAGDILTNYNYSAAPGVMTFNEDGSFQFDVPMSAPEDLRTVDCNPIYGDWSIAGASLTLNAKINNMCLGQKHITITPVIKQEGVSIKMSFGALWLMENAMDEVDLRASSTEVLTINAD